MGTSAAFGLYLHTALATGISLVFHQASMKVRISVDSRNLSQKGHRLETTHCGFQVTHLKMRTTWDILFSKTIIATQVSGESCF